MNGWGFPAPGRVTEVGIGGYLDDPTMGLVVDDGPAGTWGGGAALSLDVSGEGVGPSGDEYAAGSEVAIPAFDRDDLSPIGSDAADRVDSAVNSELHSSDTQGIPGLWIAAAAILAIFLIRRV